MYYRPISQFFASISKITRVFRILRYINRTFASRRPTVTVFSILHQARLAGQSNNSKGGDTFSRKLCLPSLLVGSCSVKLLLNGKLRKMCAQTARRVYRVLCFGALSINVKTKYYITFPPPSFWNIPSTNAPVRTDRQVCFFAAKLGGTTFYIHLLHLSDSLFSLVCLVTRQLHIRCIATV